MRKVGECTIKLALSIFDCLEIIASVSMDVVCARAHDERPEHVAANHAVFIQFISTCHFSSSRMPLEKKKEREREKPKNTPNRKGGETQRPRKKNRDKNAPTQKNENRRRYRARDESKREGGGGWEVAHPTSKQ